MNQSKIRTFSDFKKQIVVTDWLLHKDGLEISYDFNGKDFSLIANAEQACKLLNHIGAIEEYGFENDTHFVRVEVEWNENVAPKLVWIEYNAFLLTYNFSQSEAIDCAAMHEGEKQLRAIIGNVNNRRA